MTINKILDTKADLNTLSTSTPILGKYVVMEVSTPKSRDQNKILAINNKLRNIA